MKAHSLDLREKIVESVNKGVPTSETARRFGRVILVAASSKTT